MSVQPKRRRIVFAGIASAPESIVGADPADFGPAIEPHAFARHGDQHAVDAHTEEMTQLVRAGAERNSPKRKGWI